MSLNQMLEELVGREGGYVDHPADRGGPTNWGITENVARAFGYKGDMRNLSRSVALEIYRRRYWEGPKFDAVGAYSMPIAEEMFDTGVNMGPGVAAKFLQRALNVLNLQGKTYPDIVADGAIGNLTLSALGAFLKARGKDGEKVLMRMLNAQQSVRYLEIAEKNGSQEAFQFGWQLNRVGEL